MVVSLALLLACASGIHASYEEERDAAMSVAGAPGGTWDPDIRVRLSQDSLDGLVQVTMDQGLLAYDDDLRLDGPLGLSARLSPDLDIKRLSLSPSDRCDGCLAIQASGKGKVKWSAAGASGSVPLTADIDATVSFEATRDGDAWALSGRLRDVQKVKLASTTVGSLDATQILGTWVEQALDKARPLQLGSFGGPDLPLAAVRLSTATGDLELQLLSDIADRSPVPAGTTLRDPWELRISTDTLLGMARRAAFETGPVAMDTAAIPTSLSLGASSFELGLRLWHLSGAGWWRDYTVRGDLAVGNNQLKLKPTEAVEGDKSKGAGLADPLALLVEGRILDAVQDGCRQSLPGGTAFQVGDRTVEARVGRVSGTAKVLVARGTLEAVKGGSLPR